MPPLVAVTGRMLPDGRVAGWRHAAAASPRSYVDALARAGATAAVLARDPQPDIERFDGLVLSGGGDVEPARYGEATRTRLYGVDHHRDDLELALAQAAMAAGTPLLAICRGMQVLNVAMGGSLEQHIGEPPGTLDHGQSGPTPVLREIRVEAGSVVAKMLGTTTATGSCHHHQCVSRLAAGARATAWAEDGMIEAIEFDGRPDVIAVQWHPEDSAESDPVQQTLFDSFVASLAWP